MFLHFHMEGKKYFVSTENQVINHCLHITAFHYVMKWERATVHVPSLVHVRARTFTPFFFNLFAEGISVVFVKF